MTTLYNCKSEIDANGQSHYRITKFDSDMIVESSYITDGVSCECPAGERPTCRHRTMLPRFIARGAVNSFWFHDYDRNGWVSMGNAEDWSNVPTLEEALVEVFGEEDGKLRESFDVAGAVTFSLPPRINRRGF